jgi:DNA-nicking Smr family endonuclease
MRRHPTPDEIALWRAALGDVVPLRGRARPPRAPDSAQHASPPPQPSAGRERAERVARAPQGRGLDKRTAQRFRRGEMPIEARLDLHGMFEEEAHRATASFIARAHADGLRLVLLITGKGGVLREAVPRWLDEGATRARVLATSWAQPRHGGGGALYVLLRRHR